MADYGKIVSTLTGLLKDAPAVVQSGRDVVEVARELFEVIGRNESEISDADLDRLALKSDEAHAEVQRPLPDET